MKFREKMSLALAGLMTGIVAGALGFEIVAAVLFALRAVGDGWLAQSPILGMLFGMIAGPIVALRNVSLRRAALGGGIVMGLCFTAIDLCLYSAGTSFPPGACITSVGFATAAGALSGAATVWLMQQGWPWLASVSAPPPPLPLTEETEEKKRLSI